MLWEGAQVSHRQEELEASPNFLSLGREGPAFTSLCHLSQAPLQTLSRHETGFLVLHSPIPCHRELGCSLSSTSAGHSTASRPPSQLQGGGEEPTPAEHGTLSLVPIHGHSLLSSGQAVGQQSWRL